MCRIDGEKIDYRYDIARLDLLYGRTWRVSTTEDDLAAGDAGAPRDPCRDERATQQAVRTVRHPTQCLITPLLCATRRAARSSVRAAFFLVVPHAFVARSYRTNVRLPDTPMLSLIKVYPTHFTKSRKSLP